MVLRRASVRSRSSDVEMNVELPKLSFGRYRVIREVGRGATGMVYLAEDPLLNTQVCIKALHPNLANNAEAVGRFSRELRLARQIAHPGICKLFDLHQDGPTRFITMEYVEGTTLRDLLDRDRRLEAH